MFRNFFRISGLEGFSYSVASRGDRKAATTSQSGVQRIHCILRLQVATLEGPIGWWRDQSLLIAVDRKIDRQSHHAENP